jgi:hypothetical protein
MLVSQHNFFLVVLHVCLYKIVSRKTWSLQEQYILCHTFSCDFLQCQKHHRTLSGFVNSNMLIFSCISTSLFFPAISPLEYTNQHRRALRRWGLASCVCMCVIPIECGLHMHQTLYLCGHNILNDTLSYITRIVGADICPSQASARSWYSQTTCHDPTLFNMEHDG